MLAKQKYLLHLALKIFDMRQDASNNPFTAQVITSWIHHSPGIPWIQIFFIVKYLKKNWKKYLKKYLYCFFFFSLQIFRLMSCCGRHLLPWRQLHSSWWLQHLHLSAFRENVGPFWEFTCRGWEVSPFWGRFSNLFSNLVFLISKPIFTFQKNSTTKILGTFKFNKFQRTWDPWDPHKRGPYHEPIRIKGFENGSSMGVVCPTSPKFVEFSLTLPPGWLQFLGSVEDRLIQKQTIYTFTDSTVSTGWRAE